MTVHVPAVARLDRPLPVRVEVIADAGVLDVAQGTLRAQVKLSAAECGGTFAGSSGTVLLNRALKPPLAPGESYDGSASGSARPHAYGVQNICAFLDDDFEQFANDTNDIQVNVSRPCTVAADRLDANARAISSLRARLRRARGGARGPLERSLARDRRATGGLRRRARAACGPGVAL